MPTFVVAQRAQLLASHHNLEVAIVRVKRVNSPEVADSIIGTAGELLLLAAREHVRIIAVVAAQQTTSWTETIRLKAPARRVLWLLITAAWCPTVRSALFHLGIDAAEPSIASIRHLICDEELDARSTLGAVRTLRQHGLITGEHDDTELMVGQPFAASLVALDQHVVRLARGFLETIRNDAQRDLALTGCTPRCLPPRLAVARRERN